MPNSITGLQPYQFMFGCKAKTPCDNWLALNNYYSDESVSKSTWMQEHQKLMKAANQHALKSIKKSTEQSALRLEEKSCPSQRVIWSCCGITLKVVIRSKTILKIKNLWWLSNSVSPMCTKLKQSMVPIAKVLLHLRTQYNCTTTSVQLHKFQQKKHI